MSTFSSIPVTVPDLGRLSVGIRFLGAAFKPDAGGKPTLLCLHSFATSSFLFEPQFEDKALNDSFNLLAVDEFGHGATTGVADSCTFWDQARLVLAVADALKIESFWVIGCSQGGFIAARLALLAPSRVKGIALCGSSLRSETTDFGSWDAASLFSAFTPLIVSPTPTPDFLLPKEVSEAIVFAGLRNATDVTKEWVRKTHEGTYKGDDGRRKFGMISFSLLQRDDLTPDQLSTIACPVLALHGTDDHVYSVGLTESWVAQLTSSSRVVTKIVQDGQHFLSASDPEEVNKAVVEWSEGLR